MDMRYCPHCGNQVGEDDQFCEKCGTNLSGVASAQRPAVEGAPNFELQQPDSQWPESQQPVDQRPDFRQPDSQWPEPQPLEPQWSSQPRPEVNATMANPPFSPPVTPTANNVMAPPPSPPQPKRSSKAGLIALIYIVAAAGVAAGIFLAFSFRPASGPQGQTTSVPQSQVAPTQNVTQNESAPSAGTAAPTSSNTTSSTESSAPSASSSTSTSPSASSSSSGQQSTQNNVESKSAPPVFTSTDASSVLPGDEVTSYYGPNNVVDNDFMTAWVEGVGGGGVGQWVSINATTPQKVSGVRIVNGYPKAGDIFTGNHRPRSVTVSLSDGYEQRLTLADSYREYQTFNFDRAHETTYVRVRIDSIYQGAKWDDTAICELQAF